MQWNYTTVLNILFLIIATVLVIRFLRTGGPAMLKMMSMPADGMDHQGMKHAQMDHGEMMHHEMHHDELSYEQKEGEK